MQQCHHDFKLEEKAAEIWGQVGKVTGRKVNEINFQKYEMLRHHMCIILRDTWSSAIMISKVGGREAEIWGKGGKIMSAHCSCTLYTFVQEWTEDKWVRSLDGGTPLRRPLNKKCTHAAYLPF